MFPLDEQLQTLLTPLGLKIQNLSEPAKLELLTALSEFTSMAHASGVRFGRKYPEGSDKPPLIRNQSKEPDNETNT